MCDACTIRLVYWSLVDKVETVGRGSDILCGESIIAWVGTLATWKLLIDKVRRTNSLLRESLQWKYGENGIRRQVPAALRMGMFHRNDCDRSQIRLCLNEIDLDYES